MYRNVTYAFVDILRKINERGSFVTTRGNNQIEILSELIKMREVKERVILLPHRNNNIFALIAETFWVLSGRNDMKFLSHYLPRAIDFSDNGEVWRAAYGPRLRNWKGVDQLKEISRLINEDKNTKRAVMIIYDPERDYINTKDVPCNNWLHFIVRDGKLNLNVAVRANDAVWGFGGINSFEWSVLHEMMAFWTGTKVGTLSWFVGTIHIYETHFERTKEMIKNFDNFTMYDFGIKSSNFKIPFEKFDKELQGWFDIEKQIRENNSYSIYEKIHCIEDDFFRNSLEMIYIYNQYLNKATKNEISRLIRDLPTNDFKIAAIEYFSRVYKDNNLVDLKEKESEFFENYWGENLEDEVSEVEELIASDIL